MEAILVLETKEVFYGKGIGASGLTCGEVVFNTGMTGYQEILTDPSYKSQIINFTCPHIGNTGINLEDYESENVWASGVVVKELSSCFSNHQAKDSLQNFLCKHKVIGIQGIDTRYLAKKIRDCGCLKAAIMVGEMDKGEALEELNKFSGLSGSYLLDGVGVKEVKSLSNKNFNHHIAIVDFGIKRSIVNILKDLGCQITLFPHDSSFSNIMAVKPDGILLSNGPGDPAVCFNEIELIKKLIESKIPIFGICLGFQLLALALGGETEKLSFGHHGINHPIQDIKTKEIFITSQNHGFAVSKKNLPSVVVPTHYSLFDNSLQGVKHKHLPIFAVQGHPEAGPGPNDAKKLFQEFISIIKT